MDRKRSHIRCSSQSLWILNMKIMVATGIVSYVVSSAESLFKVFSSYFRAVITAFGGGYYGRNLLNEGVTNFVTQNLKVN